MANYQCKYLVIYFKKEKDVIVKKSKMYTSITRMSENKHKLTFATQEDIPNRMISNEKATEEEGIKSFRLVSVDDEY